MNGRFVDIWQIEGFNEEQIIQMDTLIGREHTEQTDTNPHTNLPRAVEWDVETLEEAVTLANKMIDLGYTNAAPQATDDKDVDFEFTWNNGRWEMPPT